MLKFISLLPGIFSCHVLFAQVLVQKSQDAYTITRMVEKFHVQPRPLDDVLSAAIYDKMLDELDDEHIFFTTGDIRQLSAFRLQLDDEILGRKTAYLTLLSDIFKLRLQQADTMVDHIIAKPFNFTLHEKLTAVEDSSYPADVAAMRAKLYKLLKLSVGHRIAEYAIGKGGMPAGKTLDSLETLYRKKSGRSVKRSITRELKSPAGIESSIGTIFCQTLSACYDPHTNYFTAEEKTRFESFLGNKALSFGLALGEDEDGNPQIGKLQPGGPAFQSGALHEGDKILSVQWDEQPAIDVTGASLAEVNAILVQEGGNRLTLHVRRSDGTTQQATLHKEKLNTSDQDEDKVKGFVLKGAKSTVGYISLPAFYEDWESDKGLNGCANDVAKEILKLKKENIQGLILDLRYNGGGSMQEAVELSGIFIDAGPVAQIKTKEAKVFTMKDVTRGTIYDGPLLIMVNGGSASASEAVAGSLQDYNRALIVGTPTYGKATAQIVLPMDTALDLENYKPGQQAASYIKITTSKLYRITGKTAQFDGVKPDILLPDAAETMQDRESDEPFALPPTPIDANKYYHPLAALPVASAAAFAEKAMDEDSFFMAVKAKPAVGKKKGAARDYSLFLDDIYRDRQPSASGKRGTSSSDPGSLAGAGRHLFEVGNDTYEAQRLKTDHDLQEANDERRKTVGEDPYIRICFQIVGTLIKP